MVLLNGKGETLLIHLSSLIIFMTLLIGIKIVRIGMIKKLQVFLQIMDLAMVQMVALVMAQDLTHPRFGMHQILVSQPIP